MITLRGAVPEGQSALAGVSTPGHGQGEGPGEYKFLRSRDAGGAGRGRSELRERSSARTELPSAAERDGLFAIIAAGPFVRAHFISKTTTLF